MTKQEQKQWDDAYAPLIEYDKKQNENKIKCLEYVKEQVTDSYYNDILKYIEDSDITDRFEITKEKPSDEDRQDEDFDHLKEVWVDQYCNGGYVGDNFAGWAHIKINEKEYLKFHYSM